MLGMALYTILEQRRAAVMILAIMVCTTVLRAQECGTALDRASKSYENGDLRRVIEELSTCLDNGLSSEDRWQGYRLVALAHLFLDEPAEANLAIQKMLEINPRYQPNPAR